MSAIGVILDKYGQQIVTGLQGSMSEKGLNASMQTSKSIKFSVQETLTKATLKITANRSIGALEHGRRKGKRPPIQFIRKWIDTKPIIPSGSITKDELAWKVATKIGREGIRVPNRHNVGGVISDVINDQLIDKIFREVKLASINRLIEATKKAKGGFAK